MADREKECRGVGGEGATASIATFTRSASLVEISEVVRDRAALSVADTIGVMLAGTTGDVAGPLRRYVAGHVGHGDARILGWDLQVPGELAAFANGTLGHALDFDDAVLIVPMQASSIVVAALLAAEPTGTLTGAALLEAYIVGIEVAAKIAQAIGLAHHARGWHAAGTIGIFGAIAGLSTLLQLDEQRVRYAVGIGSSMASGLQCNFGTMTKPLHSGSAARNALTAVELARDGWTSDRTSLESNSGFFEIYGTGRSSALAIAPSLGNPYVFEDPGVALKRYPCCYALHRAVDGIRSLLEGPRGVEEIVEIRCSVPPGGLRLLYPRPKTGLEGKFSMQYALAATALDGTLDLESFEVPQVLRPSVAELYERIIVREEERCSVGDGTVRTLSPGTVGFVEVSVRFADGTSRTATTYKPKGSPGRPLEWLDVREKFLGCAAVAGVQEPDAREVIDALERLETIDDLNPLLRRLSIARCAPVMTG
ncbi:MAG: MmgE/PrpD family protein [Acidimicrobiales bacterium]